MSERTLKEQALLERVGELTRDYEDKVADLRVEITRLVNQLNELGEQHHALVEKHGAGDVIEGEVLEAEEYTSD